MQERERERVRESTYRIRRNKKYQMHILHLHIVCEVIEIVPRLFLSWIFSYYYETRRLCEYHLFVMQHFPSLSLSPSRIRSLFSRRCSLFFTIHLQPNAISHLEIFRSNIHSDTFDCCCIARMQCLKIVHILGRICFVPL